LGQLEAQLRLHRFVAERSLSTLYQPPSHRRIWRKPAALLETLGQHLPMFAAGGGSDRRGEQTGCGTDTPRIAGTDAAAVVGAGRAADPGAGCGGVRGGS